MEMVKEHLALYREWRPKNFEDIIGQEHITTTLKNQIRTNRTAHAYLFCGTRGTGKTSSAKVFAKALNCLDLKDGEPCDVCENCKKVNRGVMIDVVELDAASNNGISNIRDIADEIKYPPQEGRYKVYILDEVHMLSGGAVNAFLKTLEEPPKHVIFILATTDPQKLPITILSRCQRFDFKRISKYEIVARMKKIANEKNVQVEDKSLFLIAKVSDGAMRDALSILDQAIAMGDGNVDYLSLVNMLGLVTNENIYRFMDSVSKSNVDETLRVIEDVVQSGRDIHLFIKELVLHCRNLMMIKVSKNPEEVLDMSEDNIILVKEQSSKMNTNEVMRYMDILKTAETEAKFGSHARLTLEMACITMCKRELDASPEVIMARLQRLEAGIKDGAILSKINNMKDEVKNKGQVVTNQKKSRVTVESVQNALKEINESLRERRQMILIAALSTSKLKSYEDGVITLSYDEKYKFNKERMDKLENKKVVNEVFSEVLMEKVFVEFIIE